MSTLTIKVCEECGKQAISTDAWLVMKNLDVRSAKNRESILKADSEIDLCGPGCLLRYISRSLEPAMGARPEHARFAHSCADEHQAAGVSGAELTTNEIAQAI